MDVSTSVYVVNVINDVRVFSTFEKALAFVSKHNNKVGRVAQFIAADREMFDSMMEEHLHNVWASNSSYEEWREDKMQELGIEEDDLLECTDTIFIHTVEVE